MSIRHVPTSGRSSSAGPGRSDHFVQAEALISARSSTVWDVITDARNFTVWESGITEITGELRNGGIIRVRARADGSRSFRLRVHLIPGEVMTWTGGPPLGLFTRMRTFTLEPHGGMTQLRVKDEFTGPLRGLLPKVPDMKQALIDYVSAVKGRAEIIG
jgi:hypothetical protein